MRRVVAIVLDGLRRDFVRPDTTPTLAGLAEEATWCAAHRSMAPSVTRVCSSSFATGCYPARHGLEANTMALMEAGGLVVHDAGHPDFLQHRRRVTGRSLDVPTLAERLRDHGGAVVYSNVSPGAAYAHDPDGHGRVYHRAGSFGPGRVPLAAPEALDVGADIAGDHAMTERFIADLVHRRPALATIWLGHPDTTQHAFPLGAPEHLDALRRADGHVVMILEAVRGLRDGGDDVLLIAGSDHGHQTVREVVDVEAEIAGLGFADATAAGDLVVIPNGTAALIYATEAGRTRLDALAASLATVPWAGEIVAGAAPLAAIGQSTARGLALFLSMAADERPNDYGVPGTSYGAKPLAGKSDRLGCGQHGGLGRYEQSPFLLVQGDGFAPGSRIEAPTSAVDVAPTILRFLQRPSDAMDGRALQDL